MANKKDAAEAAATTTTVEKKAPAKKKAKSDGPQKYYMTTVEVTFTNELLATNSADPDIYSAYLASLASDEDRKAELERLGLAEVDEKGMTVFLRNKENPMIPQLKAYTWLGFLKARSRAQAKIDGNPIVGMTAYIKEIDDRIAVSPKFIDLELPEGAAVDTLQRPLRAQTMQGDRVALAKSETVPAGTKCRFTFRTETLEGMKLVEACLRYGAIHGTGQWRNAGYGTFTYKIIDRWSEVEEPIVLSEEDFPVRA